VFVGSKLKNQDDVIINDIILGNIDSIGTQHFVIQYQQKYQGFSLLDLGYETGTFVRVDQQMRLQSNMIISFGQTHMMVNVEGSKLDLKFIDGSKNGE
jgi:hypothetical protein